jgi:hypothetical protein
MKAFQINNINYTYSYYNPNPKAKYGLGLTFWYSNMDELIFFLQYIDTSWYNRDRIDISVCSNAIIPESVLKIIKPLCNYVVHAEPDLGKQNGTMAHLNGAFYPLYENPSVITVTHTDCDEIILNSQYFFGLSNILLDSGKALLGAQITWCYDLFTLTETPWNDEVRNDDSFRENWNHFLHAFIILNKERIPYGTYYPIVLNGYFHRDLWQHFIKSGFSRDDAFLLKRKVFDYDIPSNFLYSFNFTMGILHGSNDSEYPEDEDRKVRLIKLMNVPIWENMPEGFKWHYNPHSPRPNYKKTDGPPYSDYNASVPNPRKNPKAGL